MRIATRGFAELAAVAQQILKKSGYSVELEDMEPYSIAGCYEHGSRVYLKDDYANKRFHLVFVVGATGCIPTETEPVYALTGRNQPGAAFIVVPSRLLVLAPDFDVDEVVTIKKNGFDFAVKIEEVRRAGDESDWEYRVWGCYKWIAEIELKKSMDDEAEVIEV